MLETLDKKTNDGFIRITQLVKTVRDTLKGSIGDLTTLSTTQKSSLVAALNELKNITDNLTNINDASINSTNTWSSSKINAAITQAITNLINGADGSSDTLKELADKITALVQADNGLVSAIQVQSFTDQQKQIARNNINVYSKDEIGDIASIDFVATINNTYNMS